MLQPGTGGDRAAAYISVFTWRRGNRRAVLSLRALILATGCKLLTAFYPKGTGERCVEKASRRFSDKTAIVEARIHDPLLAPPPRPVPPALPPPYLILLASGVEDTKRRTLEDPAGCLLDLSREAPVPRLLGIRGGQLHALGPMAALKGGSLTPGAPWWDIRGCGPPEDYHATTGRRAGAGG